MRPTRVIGADLPVSPGDFVKDVAVWYPLRVIMMILGVPREDDALMLRLTREMFGAFDPEVMKGRTGSQGNCPGEC